MAVTQAVCKHADDVCDYSDSPYVGIPMHDNKDHELIESGRSLGGFFSIFIVYLHISV